MVFRWYVKNIVTGTYWISRDTWEQVNKELPRLRQTYGGILAVGYEVFPWE
jgi:hypothetical protein